MDEIVKLIVFAICGIALCVFLGGLIGSFFCWLGEKRADREIQKHDAEVREKMRRHEALQKQKVL